MLLLAKEKRNVGAHSVRPRHTAVVGRAHTVRPYRLAYILMSTIIKIFYCQGALCAVFLTPPHAAWYPAWSHLLSDLVTAVVGAPYKKGPQTGESCTGMGNR